VERDIELVQRQVRHWFGSIDLERVRLFVLDLRRAVSSAAARSARFRSRTNTTPDTDVAQMMASAVRLLGRSPQSESSRWIPCAAPASAGAFEGSPQISGGQLRTRMRAGNCAPTEGFGDTMRFR